MEPSVDVDQENGLELYYSATNWWVVVGDGSLVSSDDNDK